MRLALCLALLTLGCGHTGPRGGGAEAVVRGTSHIYVAIPAPAKAAGRRWQALAEGSRQMACDVWCWCAEGYEPDPTFRGRGQECR